MAKKAEEKALVPAPEETALAVMDFEQDAGGGTENVGAKDVALPFLSIIQSNSPQLKKNDAKYIPGATMGMVFNTVTGELYDAEDPEHGVALIPCGFVKKAVVWSPRDQGGGMVGQFDMDDPIIVEALTSGRKNDKGVPITPEGNEIRETAYHHVLILKLSDGSTSWAVVSMTSTQLKHSRKWMSVVMGKSMLGKNGPFRPPSYSHIYTLGTAQESNKHGDWYGWKLRDSGTPITDPNVYAQARDFAQQIQGGAVKVGNPVEHEASETSDDTPF